MGGGIAGRFSNALGFIEHNSGSFDHGSSPGRHALQRRDLLGSRDPCTPNGTANEVAKVPKTRDHFSDYSLGPPESSSCSWKSIIPAPKFSRQFKRVPSGRSPRRSAESESRSGEATCSSSRIRRLNRFWARFYDIETGRPFFSGRDGVKKHRLSKIEAERRRAYAWYGHWGEDEADSCAEWKKKWLDADEQQ